MDEIEKFADELGPTKILHVYEPNAGLKAVLVVDNVAAGPSIGGIRMAVDVSVTECFRLARAMTMKNIAAGLPHGGGKVVVYGDPKMEKPKKETVIRALACSLRDISEYVLAPDMGTNEECMAWIKDEMDRVVGIPSELGGIPLDEIGATGWGLFHAVDVAADYLGFRLDGCTVVVQGFGAVGKHVASFLADRGAVIIGVSDSTGAIVRKEGIDISELIRIKNEGLSVTAYSAAESVDPDTLIDLECDVWIPAARPDVLHEGNVQRLKTRIVAQGANIPCTKRAEDYLYQNGTLCLPDFIVNAGGVICAATEYQRATQTAAMQRIEETLRKNTRLLLEKSETERISHREAANRIAREKLDKVMKTRRWSIF